MMTTALKILAGLAIAIVGLILSAMAYAVVMIVANTTIEFFNKVAHYGFDWQSRRTKNKRAALTAQIHRILPDENGFVGLVYDGKMYRNLDTGEFLTQQVQQAIAPVVEEWRVQNYEMRKLLTAMGNVSLPQGQIQELMEQPLSPELPLKEYVTLGQLMRQYNISPGYDNVILGETVKDGQYQLVTGSMSVFLHGIVSGRTGFGKSVQLESLAKQMVLGGNCDVCFVDYGVNTFGMLAQYGKYPIADEPDVTTELFRQLVIEMNRRRALMIEFPEARTVQDYNRITGDNIRPLVCFVDESSSLFDKSSDCRDLIRTLTSMGRKYQLGVFFGGTDFKVTTMPSETRGNCGLRQVFRLEEPQLSRSIIRSTEAVNLTVKGRALALIPEVPGIVEMQCPIVENWHDLPKSNEQIPLPEPQASDFDSEIMRIVQQLGDKANPTTVCTEMYGYSGGTKFYNVRKSMRKQGLLAE